MTSSPIQVFKPKMEELSLLPLLLLQQRIASSAAKTHPNVCSFLSPLPPPEFRTLPSLAWALAIASYWPFSSTFTSRWSILCRAGSEIILAILLPEQWLPLIPCAMAYEAPRASPRPACPPHLCPLPTFYPHSRLFPRHVTIILLPVLHRPPGLILRQTFSRHLAEQQPVLATHSHIILF